MNINAKNKIILKIHEIFINNKMPSHNNEL
jgi:hypothetical protein